MKRILIAAWVLASTGWAAAARIDGVTFVCPADNDLYAALQFSGEDCARFASASEAVDRAGHGESVFVLADGYPAKATPLGDVFWTKAKEKDLRVYVEYPSDVPGIDLGPPRGTDWQREVIASHVFGPGLPQMRIVQEHDCHFLPTTAERPWIVVGRVAGYDTAIYGLPKERWPILFDANDGKWVVATTKLSGFVSGRYAPASDWGAIWETILSKVAPNQRWHVQWKPVVHPAYGSATPLPADAERVAFAAYADWIGKSRLLVSAERASEVNQLLGSGAEVTETPAGDALIGDGTRGIQEGYSSQVRWDGSQVQRLPMRADCNAEMAMVLGLDWAIRGNQRSKAVAGNLLDYVYVTSGMCGGDRGDPKSPGFGLIAWGAVAPAWMVANYGDDNARVLLATMVAGAGMESGKWDEYLLRGIMANLRTTGKLGFRGDRLDMPAIMQGGWRPFHDAETVNLSPHFESYLWACYLWAYDRTGEKEFLEKAKSGLRIMMEAYPAKWRWGDNGERSRILLALSWLVRVEDTPEHRQWVKTIATDLLACQQPCGAIQVRMKGTGGGHYQIPQSNEAYGTGETPLVQTNADPASDQLYETGFALLGLHEAAGAMGDAELKAAEDRLAAYLCRIQVRSEKIPYVDGTWFRAFDYRKWDYWASSADLGWGVWSVEAGWAQAWTAAVLALREKRTTVWEFTARSRINDALANVKAEMAQNDGGPRK